MTPRWWGALGLGLLLWLPSSAAAVERYLDFVQGLRDRDYHDTALLYLDQIEQRADVPAEIKEVIPFERAITLLDGARQLRSPEAQSKQLDQARSYLEQFIKASPNHPKAAEANTELAQVYVGKGRVEVLQAKSPSNAGKKAELQKQARRHFAEARKVFQAAHDRFQVEYDKFDKFIPKTEKVRYDAREKAYVNLIQADLNLARLLHDEAQTHDKGSPENKKLLNEASKAYEDIHSKHRQEVAGLHGRMWQGKCFEEQDDITKALGIYNELLGHGGENPTGALKTLQDRVLQFRLICLNHDQRKDYQVVIQDASDWIKKNRNLLSTNVGLGIQWELVRAQEAQAKKEDTPAAEKNRLLQQALTEARAVNRIPGEYKDASTAMIQRLMVALDREPGDPRDFATAFGVGRNLIDDIKNRNRQIEGARGGEREKQLADLQPVLKEAARILNIALSLASSKDDPKDINRARYFLSYVYYSLRDYSYDAAILSEFVARKYTQSQPDLALEAAYLAQAAYIQAYNRQPPAQRAADVDRIVGVCNFITEHWPTSDKAHDARMNLGALFTQMNKPAEAAQWYLQVPESAPQYLEAQLAAGNAFWYGYLASSILPEAERPPREQLDALAQQARSILQSAITKYESQLPREVEQVESFKLSNLIRAKLTFSQILNGSGDYKGALAILAEGPLAMLAATSAPDGDEKKRPPQPNIRSRMFASLTHQQVLRAYVGLQDLDKARGEMKALEKIEGVGGGGASLTRIYLDLGKELEKEVSRLQTARDPRLGEVLKSFETFLDDMFGRKEGQDYYSLMWVAETYRSLGEGIEEGDPAKASGYFTKAVAALDTILSEEQKKPGFAPNGAISGVQLRKVMCLRRRKSFEEAETLIVQILKQRPKALDAQAEAAQLYQDWAARGGPEDRTKWVRAIDGDLADKKKADKDRVVWGWFGIAQRLESNLVQTLDVNPEYEKQYLDARYNVAWCRLQDGLAQASTKQRETLIEGAQRDVLVTASLSPELGGGESWERFNKLYRQIQKEMVATGQHTGEIVDLEKRSRPSRAERAQAAAQTSEPAGKQAPSTAKAKKTKAAKKEPEKAVAQSGSSLMLWLGLLAGLAVSGAVVWLVIFKKEKPHPRRTIDDDDTPIELPTKKKPVSQPKA